MGHDTSKDEKDWILFGLQASGYGALLGTHTCTLISIYCFVLYY